MAGGILDSAWGTTNGNYNFSYDGSHGHVNCPRRYGPTNESWPETYTAVCTNIWITNIEVSWIKGNTCPKGWGKSKNYYPNDTYSVCAAQGYAKNGVPIYSTVTKYRDTVYSYTAGRIAKA